MQDLKSIIERCKKSDEKAQRIIYDLMKKKWMGICVRYVKDTDEAKDVFQESTIKIFSEMKMLREAGAFEGWARRIIVNKAISHLKEKKTYLILLSEGTRQDEIFDRNDLDIIEKMDHLQMLRLINNMPDGYRTIFNLSVIDGYNHGEISSMTGISESTSRSQLTKAKNYLRKMIEVLNQPRHEKVIGL
jgi:RNA polymerase sigma factor (sigma-70 family)